MCIKIYEANHAGTKVVVPKDWCNKPCIFCFPCLNLSHRPMRPCKKKTFDQTCWHIAITQIWKMKNDWPDFLSFFHCLVKYPTFWIKNLKLLFMLKWVLTQIIWSLGTHDFRYDCTIFFIYMNSCHEIVYKSMILFHINSEYSEIIFQNSNWWIHFDELMLLNSWLWNHWLWNHIWIHNMNSCVNSITAWLLAKSQNNEN